MKLSIIIPAHNEEKYLERCLTSFVDQTCRPNEVLIVDDNSSDATFEIASEFAQNHLWIKVVQHQGTDKHLPGKKVVEAFNFGLRYVTDFDLIGKFDADIILPCNYFERITSHFQHNDTLGMCAGLLYISKGGRWVYERIADKNHIRGPIKLYYKRCFEKIGGLRSATGWDTVDTLLAKYHGFGTWTDKTLKVKHLRPTGHDYSTQNHYDRGEALYKMRYGIVLAKLAALKMALQAKSPIVYVQLFFGYIGAFFRQLPHFVNREEGRFIRKYRWNSIRKKLF